MNKKLIIDEIEKLETYADLLKDRIVVLKEVVNSGKNQEQNNSTDKAVNKILKERSKRRNRR